MQRVDEGVVGKPTTKRWCAAQRTITHQRCQVLTLFLFFLREPRRRHATSPTDQVASQQNSLKVLYQHPHPPSIPSGLSTVQAAHQSRCRVVHFSARHPIGRRQMRSWLACSGSRGAQRLIGYRGHASFFVHGVPGLGGVCACERS